MNCFQGQVSFNFPDSQCVLGQKTNVVAIGYQNRTYEPMVRELLPVQKFCLTLHYAYFITIDFNICN
jgi:hypothetical protein